MANWDTLSAEERQDVVDKIEMFRVEQEMMASAVSVRRCPTIRTLRLFVQQREQWDAVAQLGQDLIDADRPRRVERTAGRTTPADRHHPEDQRRTARRGRTHLRWCRTRPAARHHRLPHRRPRRCADRATVDRRGPVRRRTGRHPRDAPRPGRRHHPHLLRPADPGTGGGAGRRHLPASDDGTGRHGDDGQIPAGRAGRRLAVQPASRTDRLHPAADTGVRPPSRDEPGNPRRRGRRGAGGDTVERGDVGAAAGDDAGRHADTDRRRRPAGGAPGRPAATDGAAGRFAVHDVGAEPGNRSRSPDGAASAAARLARHRRHPRCHQLRTRVGTGVRPVRAGHPGRPGAAAARDDGDAASHAAGRHPGRRRRWPADRRPVHDVGAEPGDRPGPSVGGVDVDDDVGAEPGDGARVQSAVDHRRRGRRSRKAGRNRCRSGAGSGRVRRRWTPTSAASKPQPPAPPPSGWPRTNGSVNSTNRCTAATTSVRGRGPSTSLSGASPRTRWNGRRSGALRDMGVGT